MKIIIDIPEEDYKVLTRKADKSGDLEIPLNPLLKLWAYFKKGEVVKESDTQTDVDEVSVTYKAKKQ